MTNIHEGASSEIGFALKKVDGTAIAKTDLLTLTLKVYDVDTGRVINNRDYLTVLDANGGAVNTDCTGKVVLGAADNAVINRARKGGELETHGADLEFTALGGLAGGALVLFTVEKRP